MKISDEAVEAAAQAMIEGSTEYDWAELPEPLKDIIRFAAREFTEWAAQHDNPARSQA